MKVKIKNASGKILQYKTAGACAFDFEALEDTFIDSKEMRLVETGTVIEVPEGYCLVTAPRSSTFKNFGLMQVNGVGIIDQDYCGDDDSIKFPYYNMSNKSVTIKKGERIGQGMFVKIEKPEFLLVEEMNSKNRGGFGSTGF